MDLDYTLNFNHNYYNHYNIWYIINYYKIAKKIQIVNKIIKIVTIGLLCYYCDTAGIKQPHTGHQLCCALVGSIWLLAININDYGNNH